MLKINAFSKALAFRSLQIASQNVHTTASTLLKEIVEAKQGKCLVVEANLVNSPREQHLMKLPKVENKLCCSLCNLGLDVKHTDVLIISQFVRSDGCMLPRRVTKLCGKQQKRMSALVTMAHKAGLLSPLKPANCKKDPSKRREEKQFKNYWDESLMRPL